MFNLERWHFFIVKNNVTNWDWLIKKSTIILVLDDDLFTNRKD